MDKKFSLWMHYEHYKGGTNNLQVVCVRDNNNNLIKTFTSTVGKAKLYGQYWIRKQMNKK